MVRFFLILLLLGGQANAGAWPRGVGKKFMTISLFQDTNGSQKGNPLGYALYFEYGLNDVWTLGIDSGRSVSGKDKAIVFLRRPTLKIRDRIILATELGLGKIADEPTIRPGASLGYGFATKNGSGWFSIDAYSEFLLETMEIDYKADITLGLSRVARKTIYQLQTGQTQFDRPFVRFAPSLVWQTRRDLKIEFGLLLGIRGDKKRGFKLGIWREF